MKSIILTITPITNHCNTTISVYFVTAMTPLRSCHHRMVAPLEGVTIEVVERIFELLRNPPQYLITHMLHLIYKEPTNIGKQTRTIQPQQFQTPSQCDNISAFLYT
jgi:hypothetical protein